jgi:hypothetical protein
MDSKRGPTEKGNAAAVAALVYCRQSRGDDEAPKAVSGLSPSRTSIVQRSRHYRRRAVHVCSFFLQNTLEPCVQSTLG